MDRIRVAQCVLKKGIFLKRKERKRAIERKIVKLWHSVCAKDIDPIGKTSWEARFWESICARIIIELGLHSFLFLLSSLTNINISKEKARRRKKEKKGERCRKEKERKRKKQFHFGSCFYISRETHARCCNKQWILNDLK